MSNVAIRKALEVKLKSITPDFPTAWENVSFAPEEWPYQEVNVLFATPDNPTMGDGYYRQRGFLQVTLKYIKNEGPGDIDARAKLLRDSFFRGLSLVADGVTTIIEWTPEIGPGAIEGDRFVVIVKVRFYADIMGA